MHRPILKRQCVSVYISIYVNVHQYIYIPILKRRCISIPKRECVLYIGVRCFHYLALARKSSEKSFCASICEEEVTYITALPGARLQELREVFLCLGPRIRTLPLQLSLCRRKLFCSLPLMN